MLASVSNPQEVKVESSSTQTNPNYQQITVDVPEDRVAEFHAFFARFLAGRGRRGRHGRPHHGRHAHHGRRCAERREGAERGEPTTEAQATGQQPGQTTQI
jgi:hypothetical protein